MSPHTLDHDLFFLLTTMGIRFLGITYDAVPIPEGFALRMVNFEGQLVSFESTGSAELTVDQLKYELEQATYAHILGRPYTIDTNWNLK